MRILPISVAAVSLALVALPGVASAHAAYESSTPANGATVSSPPSGVTAEFTEPLAEGSYLRVFDPCGDQVDNGDVQIVGYEMSVSMSASTAGTYRVGFFALSRLDPHDTSGEFSFDVTRGEACSGDRAGRSSRSTERGRGDGEQGARGGSKRPRGGGPGRSSVDVALAADAQETKVVQASAWEGIPTRPFLAGLALAALIGAAGGKIYAGIMGPRA